MNTAGHTAADLFHAGNRLLGEGCLTEAAEAFRGALQLAPDLAEAHTNLGLVLERSGCRSEAEAAYRRALALAPEQAHTLVSLATLLTDQKRFAEAEGVFRKALALAPEAPRAWTNYGILLACAKREDEAERCYRRAMAIAPDYRYAPFNLAYVLLRQGRYAEGWERLEARDWYGALDRELGLPRWRGESLVGRAILIGIEAGHGDMIQFCRFATDLKAAGARRVSILCHPPLKALLASLAGADEILAVGDPAPDRDWDYWCPPLSLPRYLGTRLETIPARLPYLAAPLDRVGHWAQVIGDTAGDLRVGLVWKGNSRFENDRERSLTTLADLAPLGGQPGIRYFSLQKGAGEDEARNPPFPLTHLGSAITDFADTAAIIANLDLVITVDTAAAHLAGALGKPCWVLLPDHKTDWRWLAARADSPWYPTVMRLFRQGPAQAWAPVIAELKTALAALLAARAGAEGPDASPPTRPVD